MQVNVRNIVVIEEVAQKADCRGFVAKNNCWNMSSDVVSKLQ